MVSRTASLQFEKKKVFKVQFELEFELLKMMIEQEEKINLKVKFVS